jgi:hypothetical protein
MYCTAAPRTMFDAGDRWFLQSVAPASRTTTANVLLRIVK